MREREREDGSVYNNVLMKMMIMIIIINNNNCSSVASLSDLSINLVCFLRSFRLVCLLLLLLLLLLCPMCITHATTAELLTEHHK